MPVNWSNILNPYGPAFKKFILQLMQDQKYLEHEKCIDKLSTLVGSKEEYEEFGKLILSIWEAGFFKAVDENKEGLRKMGLKVTVKSQDEKSG